MNLEEALNELEKDNRFLDAIVDTGHVRAFLLISKAIRILIKEHGPNYLTLE